MGQGDDSVGQTLVLQVQDQNSYPQLHVRIVACTCDPTMSNPLTSYPGLLGEASHQ